jgi:hypothetical protein
MLIVNSVKEKIEKVIEKEKQRKVDLSIPNRYWDFAYISSFIQKYRDDIDYLELTMENDSEVREVLIKYGEIVHAVGGQYQMYGSRVDGVLNSRVDRPCMKVKYKGGNWEMLRCYEDINDIEPYTVSRKRVNVTFDSKGNIIKN